MRGLAGTVTSASTLPASTIAAPVSRPRSAPLMNAERAASVSSRPSSPPTWAATPMESNVAAADIALSDDEYTALSAASDRFRPVTGRTAVPAIVLARLRR